MSLKEKNFLVTGAAQGIGLGISKSIIEAGGKVAMIDINEEALNDAAFELEKNILLQHFPWLLISAK